MPAPASKTAPELDAVIAPLLDGNATDAMGRDLERLNGAFVATAIVTITDAGSYEAAGHFLREVAERRKRVVDFFLGIKSMANKLHRGICARENALLGPLDGIDRQVRTALQAYARAEEAKRRGEEQRLAEEARKAEEARLLDEAAHLETQGQPEMAAAVVQQAIEAPAPVVTLASQTPKVAGVSMGESWTWRAVNGDEARAIQFVPREFLTLDRVKLNQYARMHKGAAKMPGIEFYDQGKVTVRS